MDSFEPSNHIPESVSGISKRIHKLQRQYQTALDRSTPYVLYRWSGFAGLVVVFMLRILISQGWYIICYGYAIYLLNLFLAFLQPKFDPSLEADLAADEIEEGGITAETTSLPTAADDEFRPFVRRLPEWDFWLSATRATTVSICLTFTEATDVPVFWPILVMYFFVLFALTMRRQIQHMIKYKYVPWTFGKVKYGSR